METGKTGELSNNNLMIVMVLVSLLVLGVTGLIGKSLYGTIARNGVVVQKKSAAEKQLKANIAAAPGLVQAYKDLDSQKDFIASALPETADFPSLLVMMENIEGLSGQNLKSISPTTATAAAPVKTAKGPGVAAARLTPRPYALSVQVGGNYDGILKLLKEFETSARPIRVNSLQLSGSSGSLNAQFLLETYYQDRAQLPFGTEVIK